ncbi:MAG: glycine--tRNA ligase subunit beta [Candidatus Cloacimonetes bacterium]|nr:glycine--tRNA ligase subunit beta [Candidatus Cloacimonadota bacterium]
MKEKNSNDYLFEIGVEELPAGYIDPAINTVVSYFKKRLEKSKIKYNYIKQFSTPRRLAVLINGLPYKQKDRVKEIKGPPKNIAYDEDNNLTEAGKGFLRSKNLDESDIELKELEKGLYLTARQKIHGKKTSEILKEISQSLIGKINFPKAMRWGTHSISFARPIRWFLALYNSDLLKFSVDSIKTDKFTCGNRIEKLNNKIEIKNCGEYEKSLKAHYVIPDFKERKEIIENQIKQIFTDKGEQVVSDSELLNTVTNLVEFPTAAVASFESRFLKLPRLLVRTTLSEHQKYFAVENAESKKLVNKFVFVSNSYPGQTDKIKYGNERVVNARLADAAFFFEEDTKKLLEDFAPKLKGILFQKKLGTMFDKKERIVQLTQYISEKLGVSQEIMENSARAAELCKADLATLMLGEKEFTKLQGYIGSVYAKKSGENEEVAEAICDQYEYELKELKKLTSVSSILAIADRMDTVCGIIGTGMIPTGSKDPFALRRAANVIVQLLKLNNYEINLINLIKFSFETLKDKLRNKEHQKDVIAFFADRIKWLLQENDIDYDVADSVMAIDISNVPDIIVKAKELQRFKSNKDFRDLIIGFKRATNILEKSEEEVKLDPNKFIESEEKELYNKFIEIQANYQENLQKKNYKECFEILVDLRDDIDLFFDNVMVMVRQEDIRENRMALLRKINKCFMKIADLSKIVYEGV